MSIYPENKEDFPKKGQLDITKASPILIKGGKKKDQKEKTIDLIDPKPDLSARTNLAKALE